MGVFNGSCITPRAVPDPGTDHTLPPAGALSYGAITSSSALAGTNGADAALVTGNRWLELNGDLIEDIHGNVKCTVFQNETLKIFGDLDVTVIGHTRDKRIGTQIHTNIASRTDIFCHTRVENHYQKECQQQPTSRIDNGDSSLINWKNSIQICEFVGTLTLLGFAAYAVYGRACGVYIQSAEFNIKREGCKTALGGIKTNFHALMTDIKGAKLKAAGAHLKAMGGNFLAGLAFNTDSPWA